MTKFTAFHMRHQARVASAALAPVAATCIWITAAALIAVEAPSLLRDHIRVAAAVVYAVAALGGIGGLVGFWYSAPAIELVVRGYRVCRLSDGRWAYVERRPDGTVAHLTIGYKPLADTYRPPCEIQVPSAAQWDSATPAWAHGRREEILRNIAKDMGIDAGQKIHFVDARGQETNGGS